ncbi:MAG: hypothetical protein KAS59_04700 [Alphaproteobacteria bacterium]|nr:hypothetical protein [Alphaproteobacteria bacterium]
MMEEDTIPKMNREFEVHILNDEGIAKARTIALCFDGVLNRLKDLCPEKTREFAIVKTKLEEACFFAKKAMACDVANQKD